jgi:putative flippase GtrA
MMHLHRMPRSVRPLVNIHEFARFFLTGVTATIGNAATVVAARGLIPYPRALLAGLMAGLVISFLMGKLFAFRSKSARRTWGELARFLIVYAFGAALFWAVGMVVGLELAPRFMPPRWAELAGVFAGASVMVVTSYIGHRWFTFAHVGDAAG